MATQKTKTEQAKTEQTNTGRRAAARLRLSLPARYIAVGGTLRCIVTNLSRTGVLIAVNDELEAGGEGFLRFGPIDHFVIVERKENGLVALSFEIPLEHELVLAVREFQETMEHREKIEAQERAREWSNGNDRLGF